MHMCISFISIFIGIDIDIGILLLVFKLFEDMGMFVVVCLLCGCLLKIYKCMEYGE